MKYDTVIFNPQYPKELLPHNNKLCGLVLDSNKKVLASSIIEREALTVWFQNKTAKYDPRYHTFLVATICIIGQIVDIIPSEEHKQEKDQTTTRFN